MEPADCQPANCRPPAQPSDWIARYLPAAQPGGRVLDVACGGGRHLRLARELGVAATGIDRDLSGVRDLVGQPGVELIEADLESGQPLPVAGRRFGAVVVTNYLWRPLLPAFLDAVADDGLLLYETFALGHERFGRPSNPDFLLRPNELLDLVRPRLTVVAYEHGLIGEQARPRIVQRIAACGPRHPWAASGASGS
jgi:SAM-dependent methyltransferase